MYTFKETGLAWLKERGHEWVKVNAEAGDLVLCKFIAYVPCTLQPDWAYMSLAHHQGTRAHLITTFLPKATAHDSSFTLAIFPSLLLHRKS
jgi:hypothetical protein